MYKILVLLLKIGNVLESRY